MQRLVTSPSGQLDGGMWGGAIEQGRTERSSDVESPLSPRQGALGCRKNPVPSRGRPLRGTLHPF